MRHEPFDSDPVSMRNSVYILMLALILGACGDTQQLDGADVYPVRIEMRDAPGLDNRHHFEVTGETWEDAHREVGEEIWRAGSAGVLDGERVVGLALDEPAPYTRATPMQLATDFRYESRTGEWPNALRVEARGLLRSETDPHRPAIDLFELTETLDAPRVSAGHTDGTTFVDFGPLEHTTDTLPDRVDLFRLEIRWRLTPLADGRPLGEARELSTEHRIPTSWRGPTDDVTLYRETVLWSAKWAAGAWSDAPADREESEHQISLALLEGTGTLGEYGYEYGTFKRPPKDQIEDRADVFLDFDRSACGEFRGILMNLIEFHGVDAGWLWWKQSSRAGHKRGIYRTRKIAAVGRKAKQWFNTNHIVVTVNGRVYDPTYTVYKPTFAAYEDWLFTGYCTGAPNFCRATCELGAVDEYLHCVDNPPGLDGADFELIEGWNYL